MKIQLDTENKTIRIEEDVLLSKLVKTLNALLPSKEWKQYTLQTNKIIHDWHDPIIIKEPYPVYPYREIPTYPSPWITFNTADNKATAEYKVNNGTFDLEVAQD